MVRTRPARPVTPVPVPDMVTALNNMLNNRSIVHRNGRVV